MHHGERATKIADRVEERCFFHKTILGRDSRWARLRSLGALLQGANARFPGLSILPGAQFTVAGLAAKPGSFYRVPAMRMVLDLVAYLGMLAAFIYVVLFLEDGVLMWGDSVILMSVVAGSLEEYSEVQKRGAGKYFTDPWNVCDLLGLVLLASGLITRLADGNSLWGRSFYALSAPLFFFRILFFAQVLPSQGPMIEVIFSMTKEIAKFAVVMVVVMVGFAVSFHTIFHETNTFGETFLVLFKAMLGDVGFFEEFSGGRYDAVATFLLVLLLFTVTVMLLNLLVAVLSTSHSNVQDNIARKFNISRALVIRHYRLVVEEHWLPAPFNLVQFVVLLPFELLPEPWRGEAKGATKEAVGQVVFWLVLGSTGVTAGTVLWIASAVISSFVWRKHYVCTSAEETTSRAAKVGDRSSNQERPDINNQQRDWGWAKAASLGLGHLVLLAWCVVGVPLSLLFLWLRAPFCGVFDGREIPGKVDRTVRTVKDILNKDTDGTTAVILPCSRLDNPTNHELIGQDGSKIAATTEPTELLRERLGKRLESIERECSENNRLLRQLLGILNDPQPPRTFTPSRVWRRKRTSNETNSQFNPPAYKEPSLLPPPPAMG